MPKVTEAHLEARRQQILDAAFACFARQGFHQATMQDICREAELSPGAVYRYFDGKEAIIEASCGQCLQETVTVFETATQHDGTLKVLDEVVDVFFGRLDQPEADLVQCHMHIQLWGEALRSPQVREFVSRNRVGVLEHLRGIVFRAQQRGEFNPELDAGAVARVLLSAYDGLVLQKAIDPALDVWKYVEAVKAMYSGALWQGRNREEN